MRNLFILTLLGAVACYSQGRQTGGCPMSPPDAVWNTPITSAPIHASSATWIAGLTSASNIPLRFTPMTDSNILTAANTTTVSNPQWYYTYAINGTAWKFPALKSLRKREHGSYSTYGNTDHHIISVDPSSCTIYESYQDKSYNYPAPTGACNKNSGSSPTNGIGCTGQSAYLYTGATHTLTVQTTDAAGLPLAPLLLGGDEVDKAVLYSVPISHALRLTACTACISSATPLWPSAGTPSSGTGVPPYGARLRLKAAFSETGYSAAAIAVIHAAKTYGIYLADATAGTPLITVAPDAVYDPLLYPVLKQGGGELDSKWNWANFDVIDESGLQVSSTSNAANPSNTISVTVASAAPVVSVGLPSHYETVWGNGGAYPLQAYISNASNTALTWAVDACSTASACGSIVAASGVYTAPVATSQVTGRIKVASVQDTTKFDVLYLSIIPIDSGVTLRLDVAAASVYTDSASKKWYADTFPEFYADALTYDSYPTSDFNKTPYGIIQSDPTPFKTYIGGLGDTAYELLVPNGNYKITPGIAVGNDQGGNGICDITNGPSGSWSYNLTAKKLMTLETQGQVGALNWDANYEMGAMCFTPTTISIPARVTNNNLSFALRAYGNDTIAGEYYPFGFGTLRVDLDSAAAHWCIDAQGFSDSDSCYGQGNPNHHQVLPNGAAVQLSQVDWYSGLTDANWQLVSGPGTLSTTGLYTAPASQAIVAPAVIKATSASNPSYSASITIFSTGTQLAFF